MEVRLLLDTNRYADFRKGMAEVVGVLERADEIYIPFVVLAELRAGFLLGSRHTENSELLDQFLAMPAVSALYPDARTIDLYAIILKSLRDIGRPVPVHDMWIAALAIQNDLLLYARDRHFDAVAQLKILK